MQVRRWRPLGRVINVANFLLKMNSTDRQASKLSQFYDDVDDEEEEKEEEEEEEEEQEDEDDDEGENQAE